MTEQIFACGDKSVNVVGFGTILLDGDYFEDVSCVPSFSYNLPLVSNPSFKWT